MNERIQKLYEQSFVTDSYVNVGPDGAKLGIRFDPNKFAELMIAEFSDIVKETAILVAQTAYGDGEDSVSVQKRVDGALRVLEVLRKRFGVE